MFPVAIEWDTEEFLPTWHLWANMEQSHHWPSPSCLQVFSFPAFTKYQHSKVQLSESFFYIYSDSLLIEKVLIGRVIQRVLILGSNNKP